MPGGAGLPWVCGWILTAAWEGNPGCCLAQHMIFTDTKEKMGQEECAWCESTLFVGEPAGEKGPAPALRSSAPIPQWGCWSQGVSQDGRSAHAHCLLAVHMALPDLCHNEFQIPRGMPLGTRAHGVRGRPGPMMSPTFPRKAASSPHLQMVSGWVENEPRRENRLNPPPEWAFFH